MLKEPRFPLPSMSSMGLPDLASGIGLRDQSALCVNSWFLPHTCDNRDRYLTPSERLKFPTQF
jgi:hypothetical protein